MVKIIAVITFLIVLPLFPQKNINLKSIKSEINKLESELKKSKNVLKNEVNILNKYDKKIDLLKKAVKIMNSKIKNYKKEMQSLDKELSSEETKILTLKEMISHQTYILYLKGITRNESIWWSWLDWNENSRQKKYAAFLLDYENNLAKTITAKLNNIKTLKQKKITTIKSMKSTRNNKNKENKKLTLGFKKKKELISQIKNDQVLLFKSIKSKKKSYAKLKNYLKDLETKRLAKHSQKGKSSNKKHSGQFSKLKGKLNWPVKGKILSTFGRHKDKKYKIVAVNNGIDIKAKKGTDVHTIHDGTIVKITYMGGFGNTIIIDHHDGYYSVYSHLEEVNINEKDFVIAGQTVGTVGDSGSLDGSKLHFELYGNNKPRNPQKWLK